MDILTYWKNDTNPNKPKILKRSGKYTKKFLKYNKDKIHLGEVNNYIREGYFYNVVSGRDRKIKYDKRYKDKKVVTKAFKKKYNLTNGVFTPKIESLSGDTLNPDISSLKKLLIENNYTGHIRIVFFDDGIIFDKDYKIYNINKWWKENVYDFLYGASGDENPIWAPNDITGEAPQYFITRNKKISKKYVNQIFKDGEDYYCFFTAIIDYLNERLEKTKSKKDKANLQSKINYITGRQLKKRDETLMEMFKLTDIGDSEEWYLVKKYSSKKTFTDILDNHRDFLKDQRSLDEKELKKFGKKSVRKMIIDELNNEFPTSQIEKREKQN